MTATPLNPRIDVQFLDDKGQHEYLLNGQPAVSVTTVMSSEGLSGSAFWKEEHRNRGTAVHRIAEIVTSRQWSGGTVDEIIANSRWDPNKTAPVLIPYGRAMAQYLLDSQFRPEHTELPVGSLRYRLCGKLDSWGTIPTGQKMLIDWKSGEPQASAWPVQTSLYAALLEESYGLKTDLCTVIWLRADGTYKALPPIEPKGQPLAIGFCAVNLYHWRAANRMLG